MEEAHWMVLGVMFAFLGGMVLIMASVHSAASDGVLEFGLTGERFVRVDVEPEEVEEVCNVFYECVEWDRTCEDGDVVDRISVEGKLLRCIESDGTYYHQTRSCNCYRERWRC